MHLDLVYVASLSPSKDIFVHLLEHEIVFERDVITFRILIHGRAVVFHATIEAPHFRDRRQAVHVDDDCDQLDDVT